MGQSQDECQQDAAMQIDVQPASSFFSGAAMKFAACVGTSHSHPEQAMKTESSFAAAMVSLTAPVAPLHLLVHQETRHRSLHRGGYAGDTVMLAATAARSGGTKPPLTGTPAAATCKEWRCR